jgi:hypothetical protein
MIEERRSELDFSSLPKRPQASSARTFALNLIFFFNKARVRENVTGDTKERIAMDMFFRWSSSVLILFEPWQTFSWSWYLLSCIGVLALTIVLEATRFGFHRIHHQPQSRKGCLQVWFKAKEVGVYAVYMSLSYFVMLVVMTFNVGLFISVVLGHCIGMIFFPRNARQQSQFGTQQLYQQTTLDDSVNACH